MLTTKDPEKQSCFPSANSHPPSDTSDVGVGNLAHGHAGSQALHRKLRGKEVQLFAIGGAIGTCELNTLPLQTEPRGVHTVCHSVV